MLSKNNNKELMRKQEPKKQRFAIKKLTVGVASVLIGFTFMGLSVSAHADDTTQTQTSATEAASTGDTGSVTPDANAVSNTNNDQSTTLNITNGTPITAQEAEQSAPAVPENAQDVATWGQFINALSDKNVTSINMTSGFNVDGAVAGKTSAGTTMGWEGALNLTGENIARKVTINGNGNTLDFGRYSLMFENANQNDGSAWDLTFKDIKIKAGQTKNTLLTNYMNGVLSPISFKDVSKDNQSKDIVTFDGVTADVSTRPVISGADFQKKALLNAKLGETYTLNFKRTNNITNVGYQGSATSPDDGNAVEAGYINFLDGNTTISMTQTGTSGDNYGGNAVRAVQDGTSVKINNDAIVTINGGKDVRGIYAGADKLTGAIDGLVNVDGNLTENMGAGHSTAINAGNLTVGTTGKIAITTAQDNNQGFVGNLTFNGNHYGVIALGVGHLQGVYSSYKNSLIDNGSITINRTATGTLSAPLIAFGGGGVTGNYELTVNQGATLDLQDAAKQQSSDHAGMITMFGTSSNDSFNFNNPGYVNLQRVGQGVGSNVEDIIGNFLELQGNGKNQANITGTIPVSQWDQGNVSDAPSFVWSIKDLKSFNEWGTNAYQFIGGKDKLINTSRGTVIMGANQAGKDSFKFDDGTNVPGNPTYTTNSGSYAPYLNQFLNNFSWWKPQRLSFGSRVSYTNDADKYEPEVKTINGTTSQTLNGLDAKTGIKDLIQQDDTTIPLPSDATVTWYNSATDKTAWDSKMLNSDGSVMTEPTNPTGNLKTTDTSAWAKVTYGDGSVDFVNIPLNITDGQIPATPNTKSDADQNDPKGKNVNTTVGTVPSAKDGVEWPSGQPVDQNGNPLNLPDSAYTWAGGDPDVSKPGVVPAIVNVTYPDGSQDQVPVNVIVKDTDGNVPTTDPTKDNGKYDPEGKEVSTTIGHSVDPSTTIAWPNGEPTDGTPTYEWSTEPDIWSQGQHPGVVKVTYHDGTSDLVPVTVDVTNAPSGKNTTVPQGGQLPDPSTVITWTDPQNPSAPTPSGATYTWTTSPDTTTPGTKTGVVTITYPNGEKTQVPVPVTVTPTVTTGSYDPYVDPQNYPYDPTGATPAVPTVNLPSGETAPTNVRYNWGTKPDTKKGNSTQTATVIASYPDSNGSTKTKTIPVIVHIGSMADKYDPKAHPLEVPFNADMSRDYPASTQIFNVPTDVAHTDVWAPMPVTSVSGTQPTMIKVTYADGSFDYVPLNVTVDQKLSDKYPVSYNGLSITRPNDNSTASQSVNPTLNAPAGAITGYEIPANFTAPANVTVRVDPTGKVTATAVKNSKLGSFNVPVNVTYSDQLSNGQPDTVTVYVPVSITGEDHNGNYYGDQTMTQCKGSVPVLHKTTGSNSINPNDASISKLQTITYNYNWDHTNGNGHYKAYKTFKLNAAGTGYYLAEVGTQDDADVNRVAQHTYTEANTPTKFDNVNATWTWRNAAGQSFAPSTNVDAFGGNTGDTLYKNTDGSINEDEQTGPNDPTRLYGNSKWRMDYKIANTDFLRAAGLPSFYGTTGTWTNTYFDFLGATAKSGLTAHVGADVPTDTTGIEGYLNMGTFDNSNSENGSLTSVTWAPGKEPGRNGKFVQGANRGTARLIFNGNPSNYLDIPVTIAADANHVTPTDPGVNPDNPDPQHSDLFMSVTRKVFVNGPQNAGLTQTIRYARDKYTDTDGSVISYGAWKIGKVESGHWVDTPTAAATFAQEIAPSEAGKDTYVQYGDDASTKTKTNVINAENVKNSTDAQGYVTPQDGTPVYVTYQNTPATDVKVTYTFHDDTDNKTVGTPVVVTGDEGQVLPTGLVIPNGYKLAEGQTLPTTVTIPGTDETVTIHLVHGTKTVTPGEPGVTPTDPSNPAYKDLFKSVTRTINVVNPITGETEPHEETVEFGRTGVWDEADGKFTSFGDWYVYNTADNTLTDEATGTWNEFDAPEFSGYTPSQAVVEAKTINETTPDETVTITYSKTDNGDHGNGGNTNPSNPGDNNNNNQGNNGNNGNNSNSNNGNGNGISNGNGNGNGNGGITTDNNNNGNNGNKAQAKALPQTGNQSNAASVAGLGLASVMAMLGLSGYKKREDK